MFLFDPALVQRQSLMPSTRFYLLGTVRADSHFLRICLLSAISFWMFLPILPDHQLQRVLDPSPAQLGKQFVGGGPEIFLSLVADMHSHLTQSSPFSSP